MNFGGMGFVIAIIAITTIGWVITTGKRGPFDIYSLGADGVPGGEAENADIGNWQ